MLITNAAKYAYPDDAKGTIQVVLAKQEPDQLLLTVTDSGAGLPQDFDFEKASTDGLLCLRSAMTSF